MEKKMNVPISRLRRSKYPPKCPVNENMFENLGKKMNVAQIHLLFFSRGQKYSKTFIFFSRGQKYSFFSLPWSEVFIFFSPVFIFFPSMVRNIRFFSPWSEIFFFILLSETFIFFPRGQKFSFFSPVARNMIFLSVIRNNHFFSPVVSMATLIFFFLLRVGDVMCCDVLCCDDCDVMWVRY